jgi:hypothetical protein
VPKGVLRFRALRRRMYQTIAIANDAVALVNDLFILTGNFCSSVPTRPLRALQANSARYFGNISRQVSQLW